MAPACCLSRVGLCARLRTKETLGFKPMTSKKCRTLLITTCAWRSRANKATVAVPPPQPSPLPPLKNPVFWAVGTAALAISFAAVSIARKLLHKPSSPQPVHRGAPLTSEESSAVAAIGMLLLAGETAASANETAVLSVTELHSLELNLRMLITSMDAQLSDLQDALVASLPPAAAPQLDAASNEAAAAEERLAAAEVGSEAAAELEAELAETEWKVFAALQPHAADADRRTYRSLLYNRSVQRRLLCQVERQLALREKMAAGQCQLEVLKVEALEELEGLDQQEAQAAEDGPVVGAGGAATASGAATAQQQVECIEAAESGAAAPEEEDVVRLPAGESADGGSGASSDGFAACVALRLSAAAASVPHPKKRRTGGEDAFFVSNRYGAFGVADGVSGWAASGVDPSRYPRKLMAACEAAAGRLRDPLALLEHAFAKAHAPGSCTAVVASLDCDTLSVASLGDCSVRVLRNGAVVFASAVQEHKFNQPYQLASPQHHDTGSVPQDATQYRVRVQPGDVIVMGSDGLWDNLWEHDVVEVVEAALSAPAGGDGNGAFAIGVKAAEALAAQLASHLAAAAAEHSQDETYLSPFAQEKHDLKVPALLHGILAARPGGKLDDVTVVVALVHPLS